MSVIFKVGDPVQDHQCWVRPENMKEPRTVLQIDENTPGTEIAAETAAAMAASSIVFRSIDHAYARRLLNKAKLVTLYTYSYTYIYVFLLSHSVDMLYVFFNFFVGSFLCLLNLIKEHLTENAPSTALTLATM